MGRRSFSGEKRRKELARKAKREAKLERKQQAREEEGAEQGGGPPIDWEAQVGGGDTQPRGESPEPEAEEPDG